MATVMRIPYRVRAHPPLSGAPSHSENARLFVRPISQMQDVLCSHLLSLKSRDVLTSTDHLFAVLPACLATLVLVIVRRLAQVIPPLQPLLVHLNPFSHSTAAKSRPTQRSRCQRGTSGWTWCGARERAAVSPPTAAHCVAVEEVARARFDERGRRHG